MTQRVVHRLLWLVLLWGGGVAAVMLVSILIKGLMALAGLHTD